MRLGRLGSDALDSAARQSCVMVGCNVTFRRAMDEEALLLSRNAPHHVLVLVHLQ
jgi:hypothetical protein